MSESHRDDSETFHFSIPRPSRTSASARERLANVLLVEDCEDHLVITKRMLFDKEGLGCNLFVAHNSEQAFEILQECHFCREPIDLMLLDIDLPGMNGFGILESIQASDAFKQMPVVMCTVSSDAADKQRAESLGAAGYLQKPPQMDRLQRILEKLSTIRVTRDGGSKKLVFAS